MRKSKFRAGDQTFKPYNLMEIRLNHVMDAQMAAMFDPDNIFQKIHLDHSLLLNFAFPIDNPNSALLTKVMTVKVFLV